MQYRFAVTFGTLSIYMYHGKTGKPIDKSISTYKLNMYINIIYVLPIRIK